MTADRSAGSIQEIPEEEEVMSRADSSVPSVQLHDMDMEGRYPCGDLNERMLSVDHLLGPFFSMRLTDVCRRLGVTFTNGVPASLILGDLSHDTLRVILVGAVEVQWPGEPNVCAGAVKDYVRMALTAH